MGQQQYQGVGMEGSKSYKASSASGNPGGTVTPPTKAAKPEGFGWQALDYKFGDRPMYQVAKGLMKNKTENGQWCGGKAGAGGMTPAANAAQVAGMATPGAAGAAVNPDPVSPEFGEAAAAAPEMEEAFL